MRNLFKCSINLLVFFFIPMGFLLGLITGALIIYLYSRSKIYSILATEKNKYLDDLKKDTRQNPLLRECFKYIGIVAILKHSKDEKKKYIDNCDKEIAQLKKQNEKLTKENEQKEKAFTYQRITPDNQASSIDHSDKQHGKQARMNNNQSEIFFTIPESDGSFRIINARNYKEIDCFYKISIDESGQRGNLHFISGEYDLRALDNIDYYLNPVCEIQNITDRTFAKRIVMINAGYVIKRGDYWKIDGNNKVKIKLV